MKHEVKQPLKQLDTKNIEEHEKIWAEQLLKKEQEYEKRERDLREKYGGIWFMGMKPLTD